MRFLFKEENLSSRVTSLPAFYSSTNDIEAPEALDVQLGGLHIEPSEANFVLAAILNGGKKDYHQY